MTKRRRHSKEFKLDAISLVVDQGYSQTEAARNLGVNANMLGRWIKQYQSDTEGAETFRGNGNLTPDQNVLLTGQPF